VPEAPRDTNTTMNQSLRLIAITLFVCHLATDTQAENAKHLFILSGQSNMAGLKPAESFTPAVEKRFGAENVIVVHDALGGQPIRRWHKDWKPTKDQNPKAIGDLYDRLMKKADAARKDHDLASVTFIWMQGERDAREQNTAIYASSLTGIYDQVSQDLKRDDVNFVIGRLSDFDMENKKYKDWTKIRDVQVDVAEKHPRGAWVNTDDLNDGVNRKGNPINNDLHYSADGYKILGERFAEAAITLIEKQH
jgi:hypothetical protein